MLEFTPFYLIQRQLILSLFMALIGTVIFTPILLTQYRNRMSIWMNKSSRDNNDSALKTEASSSMNTESRSVSNHFWRRSQRIIQARGFAYGVAGASQTFLLSVLFALNYRTELSPTVVLVGFAVFLLPTLFTIVQIRVTSGWTKLLVLPCTFFAVLLLSGRAAPLIFSIFKLHIFLPTLIFLVFNLRFWRGAAPLVFLLAMSSFSGWMLAFGLGQNLLGLPDGAALLLLRLIGFAIGLLIGLSLLHQVAALNQQGKLSEQELFLDTWWLIYTIIQSIIFALGFQSLFLGLFVLLSFALYWLVKRMGFAWIPAPSAPPRRLLLLRVFGNSRRSERLFGQLQQAWNPIGVIELIAGTDLALHQVSPLDFISFLTGHLGNRFEGSVNNAVANLSKSSERLKDGSYPIHQYLCLSDKWHDTMRVLSFYCDAIVVDLREFNRERQGIRQELKTLSQEFRKRLVVFVIDSSTDLSLLYSELGQPLYSLHRADSCWQIIEASSKERSTVRSVINALGIAQK